jgi:DNA-binding MarR family transcriptional regulator
MGKLRRALDASDAGFHQAMRGAKDEWTARPGRFAYEGLDRTMHEKARLGVLTSLVAHPRGLIFGDLKRLCGLTDGNLSRHLQVLQEAGLVEILKGYDKNRPQTICRITPAGRRRFLDYLTVLERVVRDAADAAKEPRVAPDPSPA